MAKNGDCEHCGAPIATKPGGGRPRAYCSAACRKAAQRRRQEEEASSAEKRCEHCGEPMDGNGRFCSDRCYYYGHKGQVPFEKQDLAAYDEGLFPTIPRGQIEAFIAQQAREKPWRARVYGGKRSKDSGDDG